LDRVWKALLDAGAAGNVGRPVVFTAKEGGTIVFAGVLESQADEAKTIGADQVVGIDDAIVNLPMLDFVADTVAKMIGTTRSRVSFSMNSFQKLGFID
jgi:hypothetical protein